MTVCFGRKRVVLQNMTKFVSDGVFSTDVRIVKSSQTDSHKVITVLGILVILERYIKAVFLKKVRLCKRK